jgi:two-component system response regulator MprA
LPTILIADDERNIRSTLSRGLGLEGYATLEAGDGVEALEVLATGRADLAILDLQMPRLDGLGVLERLAER